MEFISHLLVPTWGIHNPSKLWNSLSFRPTEFILLPTCGYIYSVPICDAYLLIWTWWLKSEANIVFIWWNNYLTAIQDVWNISSPACIECSVYQESTRIHYMDHQTPKLSTSHLYLLQAQYTYSTPVPVSTPASVDSQFTWIHSPWYSAQSIRI